MLKTFFKVIAIFCLVVAIASMITYFFVYIRKYLPEYRNWYAKLDDAAAQMQDSISKI